MSFFDTIRAWLSPRPPATEADQKLRLLLRASLEIVSAYGATLEPPSSHKIPTIKLSDADLSFTKGQITGAIAILQQALKNPRLRAILIEVTSPIEARQVLSAEFERSLEAGLALLDTFVPTAEVEAERKQWDEVLKLVEKIDPAARARIEHTMTKTNRSDAHKNETT